MDIDMWVDDQIELDSNSVQACIENEDLSVNSALIAPNLTNK